MGYYLICFYYPNAILFAPCDNICAYMCKSPDCAMGFEDGLANLSLLHVHLTRA